MSQILTELKKFSKTTSVAGVSRIVNTKETILKIIWTIIFVLCTGLLIYFLVTVFIEYHKWPITSQFGEDLKNDIVFPDVTICSLNRIVNDAYISLLIENYFKAMNYLLKSDAEENVKEYINSLFYSLPSLIRNLPKLNAIDEDCPNFIADCSLYGKDWQITQTCINNFTEIWNADYYSCFTIRTSQLNVNESITGMTLMLNNGPPRQEQIPYDLSLGSSLGNGVKLTIHSPGTPPDFKRGITLAPGTETDINIVQTNVERLDKPYNPLGCTRQKLMPLSSETYARDQCIEYCTQTKIYEECGCVAQWFAIPKLLENVFVCGNISLGTSGDISKQIIELICSANISQHIKECMKDCLIPCSEKSYSSFVSSTPWPQTSLQLGIYQKYFEKCIHKFPKVRDRFSAYEHLVNIRINESLEILTNSNSTNNDHLYNDLKEIEKSLLVVKMVFETNFPFVHIDKPMYTWDVMVGVVGGLMSLWLGISAVVIAELFELIYFLIKSCFK